MKKLALVGYGKMGQMIDTLSPEYGFETVLRLDQDNNHDGSGINPENFKNVDVVIDFSVPHLVIPHLKKYAETGKGVVIGTTGWLKDLPEAQEISKNGNFSVIWSPNFSVGVNLFIALVEEAARLFAKETEYEAWAYEMHHSAKLDAPSGTLLKLVESMKSQNYVSPIDVASSRAGKVPGTHEIGFDSGADSITLKHVARNREGFAHGALRAAKYLSNRSKPEQKSEFIEFRDILKFIS